MFFFRTGYQQFGHQLSPSERILHVARALLLFNDIPSRPEFRGKVDLPKSFLNHTGLSVEEFILIGLWIFIMIWSGANTTFELRDILRTDVPALTREKIELFLSAVSATYPEFRSACEHDASTAGHLSLYSFNPLEAKPIINTDRSGYVVPDPLLLLDRVTMGIYHDFLRLHGEQFTAIFGKVFEMYVGDLLNAEYPSDQVCAEVEYGPKQGRRLSTDWIITEDDAAVLIECKVTRVPVASRATDDPAVLQADLIKGIGKAVKQLDRTRQDIANQVVGLEHLFRLTKTVPIVLTLDPLHMGNSPIVRDLVNQSLAGDGVQAPAFQVLSIMELEMALPLLRTRGFAKLLVDKMADNENIITGTAFFSLGSYLAQIAEGEPRHVPEMIERRSRDFIRDISAQFPGLDQMDTEVVDDGQGMLAVDG
jgi:hypothetical protein